jgi:hypothetical protein
MARCIDDVDNARTCGDFAALSLIGQGAMLVEAGLMILCIVLA